MPKARNSQNSQQMQGEHNLEVNRALLINKPYIARLEELPLAIQETAFHGIIGWPHYGKRQ